MEVGMRYIGVILPLAAVLLLGCERSVPSPTPQPTPTEESLPLGPIGAASIDEEQVRECVEVVASYFSREHEPVRRGAALPYSSQSRRQVEGICRWELQKRAASEELRLYLDVLEFWEIMGGIRRVAPGTAEGGIAIRGLEALGRRYEIEHGTGTRVSE
jgi:hypothetical protein